MEIKDEAKAKLRALPEDIRREIGQRLHLLQRDFSGDVKKLQGSKNQYRLRVGEYRVLFELVGGNMRGGEKVLAEAGVSVSLALRVEVAGGALQLECCGRPHGTAVLETTLEPARGPWELVKTTQLDGSGDATVTCAWNSDERMRFYRLRE
jgi:mRNA-degrading endonuclease RelE of RelBE toxin-antitoxin system